ncbi:hypothetical protein A1F94_009987 [Pyrenophora tritici-repentis]|nr:hypothetical protein A1F99_119700 [Pyrenophora tritici-repentis]KAG9379631.1 hypothetical protein A1F94_009987 [Pyrenophora tritici-repentis]KAI1666218.1 hypothetical protein L13192_09902 [Pyrenophora tritici-repentis]KAI1679212.1 hypothetical protein KJE20_11394 [Pyrenophora tritici-repentis]
MCTTEDPCFAIAAGMGKFGVDGVGQILAPSASRTSKERDGITQRASASARTRTGSTNFHISSSTCIAFSTHTFSAAATAGTVHGAKQANTATYAMANSLLNFSTVYLERLRQRIGRRP